MLWRADDGAAMAEGEDKSAAVRMNLILCKMGRRLLFDVDMLTRFVLKYLGGVNEVFGLYSQLISEMTQHNTYFDG